MCDLRLFRPSHRVWRKNLGSPGKKRREDPNNNNCGDTLNLDSTTLQPQSFYSHSELPYPKLFPYIDKRP